MATRVVITCCDPLAPVTSSNCGFKFGERSFSYSGPQAWNDLPVSLRQAANLPAFKKQLKTFLFKYWCKEDQILKIKTKTIGSKKRHLADLTFKLVNATVDLHSSDVPST